MNFDALRPLQDMRAKKKYGSPVSFFIDLHLFATFQVSEFLDQTTTTISHLLFLVKFISIWEDLFWPKAEFMNVQFR